MKTITIEPDAVAVLAHRLAMRLVRDQEIKPPTQRRDRQTFNAIVEALADELHSDILERMTGR